MSALLPVGSAQEVVAALQLRKSSGAIDLDSLCDGLSAPAATLVRRLAVHGDELDEPRAVQIFDDMLHWLRKRQRREQSAEFKDQLRRAGGDWQPVLERHQHLQRDVHQEIEPLAAQDSASRTTEHPT